MSVSTTASLISSSNTEDFIVNYLTYDNFTIEIANIDQNVHSPHSLSSTCTQQSGSEMSFEYLAQNYDGLELNANDLIITTNQINFISTDESSKTDQTLSETDDENMFDGSSTEQSAINDEGCVNVIENIVIASPTDLLASLPVVNPSTRNIQTDGQRAGNDSNDDDDSDCEELTNLTWLTELKNITNLAPSDQPITDQPTQRFNKFINQVRRIRESYDKRCDVYRNSSCEKPPFNYAQIIAMAMLEEGRMTLQQICKWIQDNFAYYKVHKNWNNSIRHNLSLNFFFTKVARDKNEKGKGGYWELAMDVSKSEKKRVRQRKRNKIDDRKSSKFNSANKKLSAKLFSESHKNKTNRKINNNDSNDVLLSTRNDESEDDYNNNNMTQSSSSAIAGDNNSISNFEIIEEQQNINNIIDESHNAIIINPVLNNGPNVIVETVPTYHFPQIETFDDNELNRLISMNEQDLIDDFLNYNENDITKEDGFL